MNPRGSNSPKGATDPGRPAQKALGSAVHPFIVGKAGLGGSSGSMTASDIEREGALTAFDEEGAKAVALTATEARIKAVFIILYIFQFTKLMIL
jgi:hypothetical protein